MSMDIVEMAIGAGFRIQRDETVTAIAFDEEIGRKHVFNCYRTDILKTNTIVFKQEIDGVTEELCLTTPDFISCLNADQRYELYIEIYNNLLVFDKFIKENQPGESNFYNFNFKVKEKDYKMDLACSTADGNITKYNIFFAIFSLLFNLAPLVKHDLAISAEYYYQRAKIERDQVKKTKISEKFIWYLNREKYIEDFAANISSSFRGLYLKFLDN